MKKTREQAAQISRAMRQVDSAKGRITATGGKGAAAEAQLNVGVAAMSPSAELLRPGRPHVLGAVPPPSLGYHGLLVLK